MAPTAYQQVAHPDGEVEMARGVSAAGGLMVVTTRATRVLEEIVAALTGPWWYQVYVVRERRITDGLVRRAAGLGATALVLTVDLPYIGFKRRGHFAPVSQGAASRQLRRAPSAWSVGGRDHCRDGAGRGDRSRDDRLAARYQRAAR